MSDTSTRIWPFQHKQSDCERYRANGLWRDQTIADQLATMLAARPEAVCIVDDGQKISYRQLAAQASRLAARFDAWGLKKGDVISFQLPNWHEVAVIDVAAAIIGLVSNPIVPIYRKKEVEYILSDARSRVMFVPELFRGFNYAAMVTNMRPALPDLERVVTVRGTGGDSRFEDLIGEDPAHDGPVRAHPDDPKLLMYTSGTTGRPKGVVHSHNTLDAELGNVARYWRLTQDDVCLMPSPVTHITGYLYGVAFPFAYGIRAVFMAQWDAAKAVDLIQAHGATFTVGATPFLQELVQVVENSTISLEYFRFFACGGAPVPPELIHRAYRALPGTVSCRVYGSTEAPTVSLGVASRDLETLAADTDGQIVGHEVRVVDEGGATVADGAEGELTTRGPEMMLGYLSPKDSAEAFDESGFFRTGDIGFRTPDDCIVVSDRRKDLIIRGGENLSAREIENALFAYPGVQEVAVVAMPHPRLGETACAYVHLAPDTVFDIDVAGVFLTKCGVARQKHPERIEVVEALPKTAAGKVQKFLLRAEIARKLKQGL